MPSASSSSSKLTAVLEAGAEQPGSSATGAPPTDRQRASSKLRARIDIDDEIEEANKIADMLKKVQKKAKTMHRSSKKAKQRLVVKASKLRAEDLERIAVLKRCGLFVSEDASEAKPTASEGCQGGPPAQATKGKVQRRMADIMSQTEGSAGLLQVLQSAFAGDAVAAPCASPIARSVVHVPIHMPTGIPLGNFRSLNSANRVGESQEAAVQAEDMDNSKDLEECLEEALNLD
jgi:hypothetical protein